jgi:histidinol-phosphatase (PHP family)
VTIIDYHLHTGATIDGRMDEISACERALLRGITEIAFTNHVMLNQPNYLISPTAFVQHWNNIKACQERFPELKIRLGIEMDYYPGREDDIAVKIEHYEGLIGRQFDFIMGAIHDIHGGFFSNKVEAVPFFIGRDLISTFHEYFEIEKRAVQSGLFDIMAHPDLIKKYTFKLTPLMPFDTYRDAAEQLIAELVQNHVGIEINTKGMKLPIHESYPSPEFLDLYLTMCHRTGEFPIITTGSDAHKLDDIGFGLPDVIESLRKLNASHITRFEQRQRFPLNL